MSALAQYFHYNNYKVAGYDRVKSDNCIRLAEKGVEIHYDDNPEHIPANFINKDETLVVYTPAIPNDSLELNYFRQNNFHILKRSEVLGLISREKKTIAIAGTHGKTSVSSITSWIMSNSSESCNAFLGGISKNFNSNIKIDTNSKIAVVEADEFDRSFLTLSPSTALITCIEADHLDIYNNLETLNSAFIEFTNKIEQFGNLILHHSVDKDIFEKELKNVDIYTYGINDRSCDFYISDINYLNDCCYFDIHHPGGRIHEIKYAIGGDHNLENALAAAASALLNSVSGNIVKKSLETFEGVLRRFDIQIKRNNFIYIDDYAHHPSEISAFLKAVRTLYPNKKLTAVFQPHLFSRTKDFYIDFAKSLSNTDELVLLPIYPAREKEIPGISSKIILDLVESENKTICEKDNLLDKLNKLNPEVLVTMGAGDIDKFVKPIREAFKV